VSAQFIIRYRGVAIRLVSENPRRAYEFVSDSEATQFLSESDAWLCASQNNMRPDWLEVESLGSKPQSQKAALKLEAQS